MQASSPSGISSRRPSSERRRSLRLSDISVPAPSLCLESLEAVTLCRGKTFHGDARLASCQRHERACSVCKAIKQRNSEQRVRAAQQASAETSQSDVSTDAGRESFGWGGISGSDGPAASDAVNDAAAQLQDLYVQHQHGDEAEPDLQQQVDALLLGSGGLSGAFWG